MEQAQYWMWMRRRQEVLKSHFQVSMMNTTLSDQYSWEEKAFAEDHAAAAAAGSLGGCIWPPRSYSCSFCRREFRSAQALGGHMNVHRRDRARLKQSLISSTPNNNDDLDVHNSTSPATNNIVNVVASTFSASSSTRVSSENFSGCNNSVVQELKKGSDSTAAKRGLISTDSNPEEAEKSRTKTISMCLGFDDIVDHVETNLSVGLNPVFFQNRTSCGTEEANVMNCKRPKINSAVSAAVLPFLVKPAASSREDLDLELRLGILPKVN